MTEEKTPLNNVIDQGMEMFELKYQIIRLDYDYYEISHCIFLIIGL